MDEFYKEKINRVVDYIQTNLEMDLSLQQLSKIACFSEFHFNRIFSAIMGEPVYRFIRRLRLEKSAGLLLANPGKTITEIALMCGFDSSSSFAKSFKNHFKMNATEWRNKSKNIFDKQSIPIQIEQGQVSVINSSPEWVFLKEDSIRQVVIEDILPLKVAYIRNVGSYQGDEILFKKLNTQLFQWAVPRGHVNDDTFTMNIYHDNPEITEKQKLRVMVAIPVLDIAKSSGLVGITKISGGKYGVCRFLLKRDEFMEAWDWMFSVWLINSGYEWDNREAFEKCFGERIIDGLCFFDVAIGIPVKTK